MAVTWLRVAGVSDWIAVALLAVVADIPDSAIVVAWLDAVGKSDRIAVAWLDVVGKSGSMAMAWLGVSGTSDWMPVTLLGVAGTCTSDGALLGSGAGCGMENPSDHSFNDCNVGKELRFLYTPAGILGAVQDWLRALLKSGSSVSAAPASSLSSSPSAEVPQAATPVFSLYNNEYSSAGMLCFRAVLGSERGRPNVGPSRNTSSDGRDAGVWPKLNCLSYITFI